MGQQRPQTKGGANAPPFRDSNRVPNAMVPITVAPVMAAIDLMPGIMAVDLVPLPPAVRVERQTHMREMDPGVGMPAVAEAIAHDIGRSTAGRGGNAANGDCGGQENLFEAFH